MASPQSISEEVLANVARSLDAPDALLPVLPDLFAGLTSLGSNPRRTVRLLREAGLKNGSRVIELAAGKGNLAVILAGPSRCTVTAVEAFEPFVLEGQARARRLGITDRLNWIIADVHEYARKQTRRFDAGIMLGLDPLDLAGPLLRRLVPKGGLYVIDDCFYDPKRGKPPPWYGTTPTRKQCEDLIRSWGDEIVTVDTPTLSATKRLNDSLYARLEANAARVGRQWRVFRPALREFLSRQRHSNRLLASSIRPAMWIIRRGP